MAAKKKAEAEKVVGYVCHADHWREAPGKWAVVRFEGVPNVAGDIKCERTGASQYRAIINVTRLSMTAEQAVQAVLTVCDREIAELQKKRAAVLKLLAKVKGT